jgi:outer membrane lipoprotein-sorting protein
MLKKAFLFLPLLLAVVGLSLAGCGGSQAASAPSAPAGVQSAADLLNRGDQVQGMSFDFKQTVNGQVTTSGKYAVDGGKFRIETTVSGLDSVILSDGKIMYMYNPGQNTAYKISSAGEGQKVETPLDYNKDFAKNVDDLKFLDTVNYNGTLCKLYSLTVSGVGDEKIWFSAQYGLPVRIEMTGSGNTMVTEYDNLKIGPQPPETFQLPAGVKVSGLGALMPQTGQTPKTPQ